MSAQLSDPNILELFCWQAGNQYLTTLFRLGALGDYRELVTSQALALSPASQDTFLAATLGNPRLQRPAGSLCTRFSANAPPRGEAP